MRLARLCIGKTATLDRNLSAYVWFLIFFAMFSLSIFKEFIFPEYFFFDQSTVSDLIKAGASFQIGASYSSTAAFYSALGFSESGITLSIISFFIIAYSFYFSMRESGAKRVDLTVGALVLFFLVLSCIYMTVLSKDFIVMLIFLPFLFLSRYGYKGLLFWLLLALLYATWFRTYWFIFITQFAFFFFLFSRRCSVAIIMLAAVLSLLIWAMLFSIVLGVDLDTYRVIINEGRLDRGQENARTMITPILPGGGPILSWINTTLTFFSLIIPAPLLLLTSPYYLLIFSLVAYLWWALLKSYLTSKHMELDVQSAASFSVVVSFVLTQSLFEPDYGSYVRHLAPLFPICVYLLCKRGAIHLRKI